MESAERNESALRRRLFSADRFNDAAIRLGFFEVKTPRSSVSASLCSVTCGDHRCPMARPAVVRRCTLDRRRRLADARARPRRLTGAVLVLAIVRPPSRGTDRRAPCQRAAAAARSREDLAPYAQRVKYRGRFPGTMA